MRPPTRSLVALLAVLAATFGAGYWLGHRQAPPLVPPAVAGFLWPDSPTLQPFELRDETGQPFTQAALHDRWTLLFFGFTHCPDICPGTLATLRQAVRALQDQPALAKKLQVVFVSVDAARDTPEVLARYVRYFDPSFRGTSAPMEQLHLLTRQLGADYARISEGKEGEYWFDHSASIFLVAPDLRIVGAFESPHLAGELADRVGRIAGFLEAAR